MRFSLKTLLCINATISAILAVTYSEWAGVIVGLTVLFALFLFAEEIWDVGPDEKLTASENVVSAAMSKRIGWILLAIIICTLGLSYWSNTHVFVDSILVYQNQLLHERGWPLVYESWYGDYLTSRRNHEYSFEYLLLNAGVCLAILSVPILGAIIYSINGPIKELKVVGWIEVVVLMFIGLVLWNQYEKRVLRQNLFQVNQDLTELTQALRSFEVVVGRSPTSEEGLDPLFEPIPLSYIPAAQRPFAGPAQLAPRLRKKFIDPWGNSYSYSIEDLDIVQVASSGPDERPGTVDDVVRRRRSMSRR